MRNLNEMENENGKKWYNKTKSFKYAYITNTLYLYITI